MSITNYQVVQAANPSALATAVLAQIALNWQPLGPVAIAGDVGAFMYSQAMTLGSPLAAVPNVNIAATDPGASNDTTQGYSAGSVWINTATNRIWQAVSTTAGAAVWLLIGGASGASPQGNPKNTAVNTVGNTVLPAAAVDGDLISRGGTQTAAFTDTTDTAVNIIAALLPNAPIGTSWYVDILNTTTFPETVAPGAGVTFLGTKLQSGNMVIAPNCFGHVLVTYTAAGAVSMLLEYVDDLGIDNFGATTDPTAANDNTQGYGPGSEWINTTLNREWTCLSAATGAAVWAFGGAAYGNGGYNPSNEVTQFGSSTTALMAAEGNINRQVPGVAGAVAPGATGADNVVAVYSIPANCFDAANRGITITAAGQFAANANNKRIKLWFNPASAVVGSTIGAGGTLLSDTGVVATNGGGWEIGGNVFKRGAAGSNTQTCTSNGAVAGGVHVGVVAPADATAVENAAILVAVTINNTTAVGDSSLVWLEVNAMN